MRAADYQQAKLERIGDRIAELKRQGTCTHGWLKTPPGHTETVCLDCGVRFASFDQAMRAGREIIRGEA